VNKKDVKSTSIQDDLEMGHFSHLNTKPWIVGEKLWGEGVFWTQAAIPHNASYLSVDCVR
jgi:hypothetical protein